MGQVSDRSGVVSKRGGMGLMLLFSPQKFHKIFTIGATTHVEYFVTTMSSVMWCGSHVGKKKRKNFGPPSPKPLHGKNLNLAHVKYSPWETSVIFF